MDFRCFRSQELNLRIDCDNKFLSKLIKLYKLIGVSDVKFTKDNA